MCLTRVMRKLGIVLLFVVLIFSLIVLFLFMYKTGLRERSRILRKDLGDFKNLRGLHLILIQRHDILMDQMRIHILQTNKMIIDCIRFSAIGGQESSALHTAARDL